MIKSTRFAWGVYSPSYYATLSPRAVIDLRSRAEAAYKVSQKHHEENIPVLEANKEKHARMHDLAKELGLTTTYMLADPKSRARTPKRRLVKAGWLEDMEREFPLDDGFSHATKTYEALMKALDDAEEIKKEERRAEAELARKKEEEARLAQRNNIEFVRIVTRRGWDEDTSYEDALNILLRENPLLNLADAMKSVREYWGEGCDVVDFALTDEIREGWPQVYADVMECVDAFPDVWDGRIFRDTEYSYDVIFGMLDKELVEDYSVVLRGIGHTS